MAAAASWRLRDDPERHAEIERLRTRNEVTVVNKEALQLRGRSVSPTSGPRSRSPQQRQVWREFDRTTTELRASASGSWSAAASPAASPRTKGRAKDAVDRARRPRRRSPSPPPPPPPGAPPAKRDVTRPTKATLAQRRGRPALKVDRRWNPSTHKRSSLRLPGSPRAGSPPAAAPPTSPHGWDQNGRRVRASSPSAASGVSGGGDVGGGGGGDDDDGELEREVEETQRRLQSVLDAIDVRASVGSPGRASATLAEAERQALAELRAAVSPARRAPAPAAAPSPPREAPAPSPSPAREASPARPPAPPARPPPPTGPEIVGEVARAESELQARAEALQADMARLRERKEALRRQLRREELEAECARRLQGVTAQLQEQLQAQLQALHADQARRLDEYAAFASDVDGKVQALLAMKAEAKAKAQQMTLEFEAGARELQQSYAGLVSEARQRLEAELGEALGRS